MSGWSRRRFQPTLAACLWLGLLLIVMGAVVIGAGWLVIVSIISGLFR